MGDVSGCLVLQNTRITPGEWKRAFSSLSRQSKSQMVVPKFSQSTTLAWQPSQSLDNEDHSTKSTIKTRSNKLKHLSRSESYLPYTWKRSDSLADGLKSATDLSYKNTYGDQLSTPFELKLTKELPIVKQKTSLNRTCLKSAVDSGDRSSDLTRFRLPTAIVTKIYDKLHCDAEDTRCMYVIKNMRRTTPASKSTNLPTIVPFYNVQLVKSVSKVLTEELLRKPSVVEESHSMQASRPVAAERKYYSPSTGKLIKSKLRPAGTVAPPKTVKDGEIPSYLSSSKVFKSAEAYNKLLTVRQATKDSVGGAVNKNGNGSTGSARRKSHDSAAEVLLSITGERANHKQESKDKDAEKDMVSARGLDQPAPTQHITSIKVEKRVAKEGSETTGRLHEEKQSSVEKNSKQNVVYIGEKHALATTPTT